MKGKIYRPGSNDPVWLEEGHRINEAVFCETFMSTHKIIFCNGFFFTEDGRVTDEMPLRSMIYEELRDYASNNIARKVGNILDLLKLSAQVDDFRPITNCIHLANGTLNLDGSFQEGKTEVVRNRLPVRYNPAAVQPAQWLQFLSDLLYPEDIPTVQEFIGYCLIPSNKGQRMMVIKGRGGEGKSQIGVVLSKLELLTKSIFENQSQLMNLKISNP